MAKQPTERPAAELLNPEQLVDLVAEFIKECRERPKAQSVSAESVHLASLNRDADQPAATH